MQEKLSASKMETVSKSVMRGTMNEEELRYNKQILKEISMKKKEQRDKTMNSTGYLTKLV